MNEEFPPKTNQANNSGAGWTNKAGAIALSLWALTAAFVAGDKLDPFEQGGVFQPKPAPTTLFSPGVSNPVRATKTCETEIIKSYEKAPKQVHKQANQIVGLNGSLVTFYLVEEARGVRSWTCIITPPMGEVMVMSGQFLGSSGTDE